jgi:2-hydroxychromene-2-carboxylate isomerase
VPDQPTFFYDLGSPECYLVAERVTSTLPFVVDWEPVLGRSLGVVAEADVAALTGRAVELELLPLRIPAVWPPDTEFAMLTATYAKQIGRSIAFSLAAFRQAFAGGRDLGDRDTVLIAAAACEMHPTAILKGVSLRSVTDGLRQASLRARALGVTRLPAIAVGDELFCGEDAPERAAALGAAR